jgi:hypothetical protein
LAEFRETAASEVAMKIIRKILEVLLVIVIVPIVLIYCALLCLFHAILPGRDEPQMSSVTEDWIGEKSETL